MSSPAEREFQRLEKPGIITRMQSDGRLVKNIEHLQVGAKLGGKADALRLAAAQRVGRTIQCQIAQSYLTKEAQALNDLGNDVGGNFFARNRSR